MSFIKKEVMGANIFQGFPMTSLNFSSATYLALEKRYVLFEDQFLLAVEDFISKKLKLVKDSISDTNKIHSKS